MKTLGKQADRAIRPDMDPQKLRHFLRVFDHGNFRRAAEAGNVTQQAVSKAVARLEEQLGLKLFQRKSDGVYPTDYGKVLARHAKAIVAEMRLAAAELSAMRGATRGYLQVGFGWSFIPRIGPEVVARFREARPEVGLRLVGGNSAELYPQLLQGELDLVVSAPPEQLGIDAALETSVVFVEHDAVVVRAAHPLAGRTSLSMEDLSQCTWLMALTLEDRWHAICKAFVAAGSAPPQNVIDVQSLSLAKAMLARGDYVCLLSEELVAAELELGLYQTFRLDALPLNRPALIAVRRGADLQPVAASFRTLLTAVVHEFYPPGMGDN